MAGFGANSLRPKRRSLKMSSDGRIASTANAAISSAKSGQRHAAIAIAPAIPTAATTGAPAAAAASAAVNTIQTANDCCNLARTFILGACRSRSVTAAPRHNKRFKDVSQKLLERRASDALLVGR